MNPVAREVFELISAMGIGYQYVEHPPVETIEDCFAPAEALNAVIPKNLFLCPRNQSSFHLLLVRPDAVYRTADISKQLGVSRLSFGPSEKLYGYICRPCPGRFPPWACCSTRRKRCIWRWIPPCGRFPGWGSIPASTPCRWP